MPWRSPPREREWWSTTSALGLTDHQRAAAAPRKASSTRSPPPVAKPSPVGRTSPTGSRPRGLIQTAVDSFGGLDVLVNNAGIVRDRMFANTSEEEFDAVIAVHLKGHFATMRHAAAYWRAQSKAGNAVDARIINTSSGAGLQGSVGQANYSAARPASRP